MIKTCTKCFTKRLLTDFYKNGKYLTSECKFCRKLREKLRYEQNPQKIYARTREYIKNNPEKQRRWQNEHTKRQRIKVLEHYGKNCACCSENNIEFLTIDHINGGGNQHRKEIIERGEARCGGSGFYNWLIKNNFPEGFRTLCQNCNASLGHYGYCPHKNTLIP